MARCKECGQKLLVIKFKPHDFRINSDGWIKKTDPNGIAYLENPEGDVWELVDPKYPELVGKQLFTWDAAMRETALAGEIMPTDEDFDLLFKTKADMPNLLLSGYRGTDGSFVYLSGYGYFWSSLESGSSAWRRALRSSYATVHRDTNSKAFGFSVRCLKD